MKQYSLSFKKKKTFMQSIRKRQLAFLGHIVRADALEKLCIEGKADGVKPRGRPRRKYLEGLALAARTNKIQLLRKAKIGVGTKDWSPTSGSDKALLEEVL